MNNRPFYRAPEGVYDRCTIFRYNDKSVFSGIKVHFDADQKRYVVCANTSCCEKWGKAQLKAGCALLIYGDNKSAYKLYPWIIGEKVLKELYKTDPFKDFVLYCTSEKFQTFEISPLKDSLMKEFSKKVREKIYQESKEARGICAEYLSSLQSYKPAKISSDQPSKEPAKRVRRKFSFD
jgi:hypothetical protein